MSRSAFSLHMLLHLGLVTLAAPLLAAGLRRLPLPSLLRREPTLLWMLLASFLEMLVVWGWHAPPLHEAAARSDWVFALQQASFLGAGLAIWGIAFAGRSKVAQGLGLLAMLMIFVHMTMLGLLLALAPRLLYAPELCIGAFGFERLEDQHLGGLLMAVAGGLPFLLGGAILAHRFIAWPPEGREP